MEKKSDIFVTTLEVDKKETLKQALLEQGFSLAQPNYTHFQAKKKGISLTFYESGKLVVQGKEKHDFITFFLEPEILKTTDYSYPEAIDPTPRIGIDEAGKGDFFGPLCIAGLYVNGQSDIDKLLKYGVKDSKKISDRKILEIASLIRKNLTYSLVILRPIKYNELYNKFRNLNALLAWGHAASIEKLYNDTSCKTVILDQFANENVVLKALSQKHLDLDVTQRHKGEEDIVVAGASILARASFVEQLDNLSKHYNLILPKGVSPLVKEKAREAVFLHGKNILGEVAKLHFKTTDEILKQQD